MKKLIEPFSLIVSEINVGFHRSIKFMSIFIFCVLITVTNCYSQFLTLKNPNLKPAYENCTPVISTDNLQKVSVPNTVIETVVVDPKGFCQVIAVINHPPSKDRVKVWINLPLQNWNGRFCGTGGGGFAGGFPEYMGELTKQGFAVGSTNTGHDGWSGSFALDTARQCLNWQEIRDYAYLGIHDMNVFAKSIIKAFYGHLPRYSYFIGGSNGGRQGLNEAQRYPDDFDGILAYFPGIHVTNICMGGLWPQAVMVDANHFVSVKKQIAVTKAAVDACDGNDGVTDGVIDDPDNCTWDPVNFIGTKVEDDVFTEEDANVMRKIWEGPRTHDGKFLWHGLPRGAVTQDIAGEIANYTFFEWLKYFIVMNPDWDKSNLTIKQFELFWNQSMEQYSEVFRADNPNLEPFRSHGGKLLIIHGLADQLIPYQGSVTYYESVLKQMGGAKSTSDFIRLFLVPGVDHSLNGAGLKPVGEFDSLVSWVEKGNSRRPVFPYPYIAKYKGTGSVDNADSFIKFLPK
jgi:feruloyl esterase